MDNRFKKLAFKQKQHSASGYSKQEGLIMEQLELVAVTDWFLWWLWCHLIHVVMAEHEFVVIIQVQTHIIYHKEFKIKFKHIKFYVFLYLFKVFLLNQIHPWWCMAYFTPVRKNYKLYRLSTTSHNIFLNTAQLQGKIYLQLN